MRERNQHLRNITNWNKMFISWFHLIRLKFNLKVVWVDWLRHLFYHSVYVAQSCYGLVVLRDLQEFNSYGTRTKFLYLLEVALRIKYVLPTTHKSQQRSLKTQVTALILRMQEIFVFLKNIFEVFPYPWKMMFYPTSVHLKFYLTKEQKRRIFPLRHWPKALKAEISKDFEISIDKRTWKVQKDLSSSLSMLPYILQGFYLHKKFFGSKQTYLTHF